MNKTGIAIGNKLKAIREKLGWTQLKVEKQTTTTTKKGLKREYLSRIENPEKKGGFTNLQMSTLERLLKCYGYSFKRFFKEIDK